MDNLLHYFRSNSVKDTPCCPILIISGFERPTIVNCVLNSIASWHVLCPTTRTGRLTKGKFQALHCDRMSCPAFQCLRGLTSLTSPIRCVCSVHIQSSTDSSLRDFMSINHSNSLGPQRTLRTIDTSMGASVPIRLKTQFSHVLRFYHVTCQLGVLVHVLYFCKDYDSIIPRTQPQKVHHGCHRYVSIVAQLDYLLYFNIPRTEKYSIAMCYRYLREAKKCKI